MSTFKRLLTIPGLRKQQNNPPLHPIKETGGCTPPRNPVSVPSFPGFPCFQYPERFSNQNRFHSARHHAVSGDDKLATYTIIIVTITTPLFDSVVYSWENLYALIGAAERINFSSWSRNTDRLIRQTKRLVDLILKGFQMSGQDINGKQYDIRFSFILRIRTSRKVYIFFVHAFQGIKPFPVSQ